MGTFVALIGQLPGGLLVDAIPSKRLVARCAVFGIGLSALLIAATPVFALVATAKFVHIGASCILGPAIAAITLGMVGHARIAIRLGRNARFSAMGNGIAAGVMGAVGYFGSPQAVFFVTAFLAFPALIALHYIREDDIDPVIADGGIESGSGSSIAGVRSLLRRPALRTLAACILLFQFANAAMLPLVGSDVTMRSSRLATILIAACLIGPQLIVAAIAPRFGSLADRWGRRPILLLGLVVLPVRAAILAVADDPVLIAGIQLLDGVTAAAFGVVVPLMTADISKGTGHFNLAQGIIGTATGIGATCSLLAAGLLADHFGAQTAFAGLATASVLALLLAYTRLPETMPIATNRAGLSP